MTIEKLPRRAMGIQATGCQKANVSLTGEDRLDIFHHTGTKIYKRFQFYRRQLGRSTNFQFELAYTSLT